MTAASTKILDPAAIERALSRMAHEIIEQNPAADGLALVGVQSRGVYIAHRLAVKIEAIVGATIPTAEIDTAMHRDDLAQRAAPPPVRGSKIPFDVKDKNIVIVDDVLYTGRSCRAAMEELLDYGRPRRIQLAVLVDRGHRELPIRADYVGKNVPTAATEKVRVHLKESDGNDEVVIEK